MAIAATAVADLIAPPPAANSRAAPDDAADTSFDDHLEAEEAKDAQPTKVAKTDDGDDDDTDEADAADTTNTIDSGVCVTQPAPQPEPTAAPVLLQLIAAAPETPPPAPEAPEAAPVQAAAPVDDAPAAPIAPAAPARAEAEVAAETPAAARNDESNAKSETQSAPVAQADATPAAKPAPTPEAPPIATPAPTATPAPATAESQQAVQAVATPAPTAAQAPREAPPRMAKSASSTEAKSDEPVRDPKNDAPRHVAQKSDADGKSAPVAAAAKDASVPAPPARDGSAPAVVALATQTTTQTQHAVLDQTAARAAPVAAQVGHEIVRRFNGGNTHFDMRLDPPELGRVDVRLEVSRDHRVTAVVSADSPQALTELARHARELEQTLQSAGLELSDSGLSFDLRQGGEGGDRADNNRGGAQNQAGSDDAPQEPTLRAQPLGMERWRGIRVDVMV